MAASSQLPDLDLSGGIVHRYKEWQKDYGSTVEGAITELEKIEFVKTAGGWRLKDAVTKRQRDLLKVLRLDLSFMKEIESAD